MKIPFSWMKEYLGMGGLFILIITVAATSALVLARLLLPPPACTPTLKVGDAQFDVLLAETPALQHQGLSGRPMLEQNQGMLFLFQENTPKVFWMKDMRFAIDIVWLAPDWTMLGWEGGATPESYPTTFTSPENTQFVLEIPAGSAVRAHFTPGEKAVLIRCGS